MDAGEEYWVHYNFRCTGVFVIESLSESWKTGKELFDDIIKRSSERINYDSYHTSVSNRNDFFLLMENIVDAVLKRKHFPILHFEIHGSESGTGLVLTSGELVTWTELAFYCRQINVFTKNELVITLSTCYAAQIYQSLDFSKPAPFWGFLAPKRSMETGILYEDYIKFYEIFFAEKDLAPAVDALNLFDDKCPYVFGTAELIFDRLWEMSKEKPPIAPANLTRSQRRAAMKNENDPLSGDLFWIKKKNKFLIR